MDLYDISFFLSTMWIGPFWFFMLVYPQSERTEMLMKGPWFFVGPIAIWFAITVANPSGLVELFQDMSNPENSLGALATLLATPAGASAAWAHMVAAGYGRLMFTSSPFGLYAASTFAHYSAAKAAMLGLSKALALEGKEHNIHANAVAPFSASRMTGRTNEEQETSSFGPRYLAQLAIYLCHESTAETGGVFEVGGGYVHRVRNELSNSLKLMDDQHTAENIAANKDVLNEFNESQHPGVGDSWTIGREVHGDDWQGQF